MNELKIKESLLNDYDNWVKKNPMNENPTFFQTLNHMERFANYLLSIYRKGFIDGKKEVLKRENNNLN